MSNVISKSYNNLITLIETGPAYLSYAPFLEQIDMIIFIYLKKNKRKDVLNLIRFLKIVCQWKNLMGSKNS